MSNMKKKIMIMVNSLYGGGAEKVLQTLLRHLDLARYDITLYSMHRETLDPAYYPTDIHYRAVFDEVSCRNRCLQGILTLFYKIRGKLFSYCAPSLFYRLFIRGTYDVEIAFIEGESTKIISGSTNRASKKYAWVHIDLEQNPWTAFLYHSISEEAHCYQKFDKIFCVSNGVRDSFLRRYQVDPTKAETLYNPIDRDEILQKSTEPASLPMKDTLKLVTVGRLVHQKGYDRLVRVADRLVQEGFDFVLYIIGEGEERASLEQYIREHNLQDNVILLGYQANPYRFMRLCDLFVCSSRAEGFSTVITEAVILGLPIISTDCAGVREIFGEELCGMIIKNSEEALLDGLRVILTSKSDLDLYRQNAYLRGVKFDIKEAIRPIEKYLLSN